MGNKLVDLVIPVHNRLRHTEQTLQSLFENTDFKLFNLYVIDDGSEGFTMNLLEDAFYDKSPDPFIKLFRNEIAIGPGASRNLVTNWITKQGLRSKYLYHSDNDVFFIRGWLDKLLSVIQDPAFENSKLKLLGGGCHPYLQNNNSINLMPGILQIGLKDAVSGYSQLMTWETWDQFGPFDETMRDAEKKIMGSEDWAFCQKIIKAGFQVGSIEPEVVIATGKTNTYGEPATGSETFKEKEGIQIL